MVNPVTREKSLLPLILFLLFLLPVVYWALVYQSENIRKMALAGRCAHKCIDGDYFYCQRNARCYLGGDTFNPGGCFCDPTVINVNNVIQNAYCRAPNHEYCREPAATATPTPTNTPIPGATVTPTPSLTPSPTPTASPTPTSSPIPTATNPPNRPAVLYFKTEFESFSDTSQPSLAVTLQAKGTNFSKTTILNQKGESEGVVLEGLTPGSYEFLLSSWGFLTAKRTADISAGRNPADSAGFLDFGVLKTGDLNTDNQVNGLDWSLMKLNYGESGD